MSPYSAYLGSRMKDASTHKSWFRIPRVKMFLISKAAAASLLVALQECNIENFSRCNITYVHGGTIRPNRQIRRAIAAELVTENRT